MEKNNGSKVKNDETIFGFGIHEASTHRLTEVEEFLKPLLVEFRENYSWYGFKETSFEDACHELKTIIKNAIQLIEKNN